METFECLTRAREMLRLIGRIGIRRQAYKKKQLSVAIESTQMNENEKEKDKLDKMFTMPPVAS